MSRQIPIPKDVMGNPILKDTLVTLQNPYVVIWKVVTVENGGISTPQGDTPALVRIMADISLRKIPGIPFIEMVRVVAPTEQAIAEDFASKLMRQ